MNQSTKNAMVSAVLKVGFFAGIAIMGSGIFLGLQKQVKNSACADVLETKHKKDDARKTP